MSDPESDHATDDESDESIPSWKLKGGEFDAETWDDKDGPTQSRSSSRVLGSALLLGLIVGAFGFWNVFRFEGRSDIGLAISMAVSSFIVSLGSLVVVTGIAFDRIQKH